MPTLEADTYIHILYFKTDGGSTNIGLCYTRIELSDGVSAPGYGSQVETVKVSDSLSARSYFT